MGKGEETRQAILDEALALASKIGISGLSVGSLAERTGMSKSGLFAHFGSKEEMQIAVIRESQERFADVVVRPALKEPRGLPRLRAMFGNWLGWTQKIKLPGGCLLISAASEFDDQPGPVRDAVAAGQKVWRDTLAHAVGMAVEAGELRPDTDIDQFVFEMVGIVLVCQQNRRLFHDKGSDKRAFEAFDRLVRDRAATGGKRKKE
ncbi:MAG: TetR family transcriptional regulator [Rhodocyclaceae bacterium]|jgi:AcrR family transcriptional regulator|nr:TetR family transcriptional regulator [Rhodocyclaceae bacterium]